MYRMTVDIMILISQYIIALVTVIKPVYIYLIEDTSLSPFRC